MKKAIKQSEKNKVTPTSVPIKDAKVASDAKIILNNPKLYEGSSGYDFIAINNELKRLGYLPDSYSGTVFDSQMKAAVNLFQAFNGLESPDGIIGKWSRGLLLEGMANALHELQMGEKGNTPLYVQNQMKNKGVLAVKPDGWWGNKSKML